MSGGVENQTTDEKGELFEAIRETIQNLQTEFNSKSQVMLSCMSCSVDNLKLVKESQSSLFENTIDAVGKEMFKLQTNIKNKLCQLRSVCRDEDDVEKFDELFYRTMVQGLALKETATELAASQIRESDELSNEMGAFMEDFRHTFQEFLPISQISFVDDVNGGSNETQIPAIKSNDEIADELPNFTEDLLRVMFRAVSDDIGACGGTSSINGISASGATNASGETSAIGDTVKVGTVESIVQSTEWASNDNEDLLEDFKQLMISTHSAMECALGFGDAPKVNNKTTNAE